MFKEDPKKSARQEVGFQKWRFSKQHGASKNGQGLIKWVGAMGKTYASCKYAIKPYVEANFEEVVILVPLAELIPQWHKTLRATIQGDALKRVYVNTVQGYHAQGAEFNCGLLVIDEIHKFYGEEFIQYIDNTKIKFKHCLGLSATPFDPQGKWKLVQHLYPVVDEITPEEARREGYTSEFAEFNLGIDLSATEQAYYEELSQEIAAGNAKFGKGGFLLALKCVGGGKHPSDNRYYGAGQWAMGHARDMGWKADDPSTHQYNPSVIIGLAKKLIAAVQERKALVQRHPVKRKIVQELLDKFKEKTIIFGESTNMADDIHEDNLKAGRKSVVFHSNIESRTMLDENGDVILYGKSAKKAGQPKSFGKDTLRKYAITSIREGTADIIVSAKALDVGFDVPTMRMGIIVDRNSNANNQLQRLFRIFRIDPDNPEDTVLAVNIYIRNTVDERWLKSAQRTTTSVIHEVESVEDIFFNPVNDEFEI